MSLLSRRPVDSVPAAEATKRATGQGASSNAAFAREDARELAGHADLRTTAMYDRSREKHLQNEVERMVWPEAEDEIAL